MEPIVVKITGDTTGLTTAANTATGSMGGLKGAIGGLTSLAMGPAGLATMAVGAAAALGEMTLAAAADREEQAKLQLAIKNAGAATAESNALVDSAIKKGQDRAFTDTEVRDGLLPLIQSTGDVEEATRLMGVAQDLARLKGVSLESASLAIAKATEGQDGALIKLLPSLKNVEEGTDLVATAAGLAAGQADLFGASAEGQSKTAKIAFSELGEKVGEALLPILDALVPALSPFMELLGVLIDAVIPVLVPLVKTIATAFTLVTSAIKVALGVIKDIIKWINDLITKVQEGLKQLQDLVSFDIPTFDIPDLNPFDNAADPWRPRRGRHDHGLHQHWRGPQRGRPRGQAVSRPQWLRRAGMSTLVDGAEISIIAELGHLPFLLNVHLLDEPDSILNPVDEVIVDVTCEVRHATWRWGSEEWAGPLDEGRGGLARGGALGPRSDARSGEPRGPRPSPGGAPRGPGGRGIGLDGLRVGGDPFARGPRNGHIRARCGRAAVRDGVRGATGRGHDIRQFP